VTLRCNARLSSLSIAFQRGQHKAPRHVEVIAVVANMARSCLLTPRAATRSEQSTAHRMSRSGQPQGPWCHITATHHWTSIIDGEDGSPGRKACRPCRAERQTRQTQRDDSCAMGYRGHAKATPHRPPRAAHARLGHPRQQLGQASSRPWVSS